MQGWMIALIVVACVVVVLAVAFLIASLVAVHIILGRRKTHSVAPKSPTVGMSDSNEVGGENGESGVIAQKQNNDPVWYEEYGIDVAWFDEVAQFTSATSITAFDGIKLGASLIKHSAENSDKVAVCCHGYGTSPRAMQVQAKLFYDCGFDVLLPSMRGHCDSEGKVGMAWLDRFDLLRWVDKIIELYGEQVSVAMCGVSMGGATVIAAAGMNPPPQVKCVIDDCGFSSQYDEYTARLKKISFAKSLALLPLSVGVRLVHGYSLREADIVPLAKNMTMPALFIHGEADKFVPIKLGQKLFDACGSTDKQFLSVPEAIHAAAYAKDPKAYSEAFTGFVNKCFPDSEK